MMLGTAREPMGSSDEIRDPKYEQLGGIIKVESFGNATVSQAMANN